MPGDNADDSHRPRRRESNQAERKEPYFIVESPAEIFQVDVVEEDHRVTLHPFAQFTHAETSNVRNDIPRRVSRIAPRSPSQRFLPVTMNEHSFEDEVHETLDFVLVAFELKKPSVPALCFSRSISPPCVWQSACPIDPLRVGHWTSVVPLRIAVGIDLSEC